MPSSSSTSSILSFIFLVFHADGKSVAGANHPPPVERVV